MAHETGPSPCEKNDLQSVDSKHCVTRTGATLLHIAAAVGSQFCLSHVLDIYNAIIMYKDEDGSLIDATFTKKKRCFTIVSNTHRYKIKLQLEITCPTSSYKVLSANDPDNLTNIFKVINGVESEELPAYTDIYLGEIEVKSMLLQKMYPVDYQLLGTAKTALHVAFESHNLKIAKVLLESGADVNITCNQGKIPFARYYRFNDSDLELEVIKIILQRANTLSSLDEANKLQMFEFLYHGKRRCLKALFQSSVNFTAQDIRGNTPLHYLAMNPALANDQELLDVLCQMLCRKKIDINAVNVSGKSALYKSAMFGIPGMLELLLNLGASVKCPRGLSLLNVVCQKSERDSEHRQNYNRCAEILLRHGADPQISFTKRELSILMDMNQPIPRTPLEMSCGDFSKNENVDQKQLIIAYLAIIEARGTTITHQIRNRINRDQGLLEQFNLCKFDLINFQKIKVLQSISIFDIMFASEEKISPYLRNQEFLDDLKHIDDNIISKSAYSKIFWNRLEKALQTVKAKRKAATVIAEVMGLSYDSYYMIIDKIIGYFWSYQTLRLFS